MMLLDKLSYLGGHRCAVKACVDLVNVASSSFSSTPLYEPIMKSWPKDLPCWISL